VWFPQPTNKHPHASSESGNDRDLGEADHHKLVLGEFHGSSDAECVQDSMLRFATDTRIRPQAVSYAAMSPPNSQGAG